MIHFLLDQEFCTRFVQALAHFLWQGLIIAAVAAAAGRALANQSPRVRYALYLVTLCAMVACIPVSFALLSHTTGAATSIVNSRAIDRMPNDSRQAFELKSDDAWLPTPDGRARADGAFEEISRTMVTLYALGVFWMLCRLLAAVCGGQRLATCSQAIDDEAVLSVVTRAVKAMGFRYNPPIAYCSAITVPAVVGVLKPMLLLSLTATTGLTREQLQLIVMHELAHIRRHDHIINLIQRFIESFLFFHPAIWYISRRISEERELCCDAVVAAASNTPVAYAESLARVAELQFAASQAGAIALNITGERPSELHRRVLGILGRATPERTRLTRRSSIVATLVGFTCLFAFLCCAVRVVPASLMPPPQERLGAMPSAERLGIAKDNAATFSEWSKLHRAVVWGDFKEVKMLLKNGANPNIMTSKGWTPMHFAATLNRADVVETLTAGGADVDAKSVDGRTPLHCALGLAPPLGLPTDWPAERAVRALLSGNANVNACDSARTSPLHAAVFRQHLGTTNELIARGAKVNASDRFGRTALHYACAAANLSLIELLLDKGADPALTDGEGWGTLQHLTLRPFNKTEPRIIYAGSKLLRGHSVSPDFCSAIVLNDKPMVQRMLADNPGLANQLPSVTRQGWKPIHWAVGLADESMCELLMSPQHATDPNARTSDGRTALHISVERGVEAARLARLLIRANGRIDAANNRGLTPLHLAALARNAELVTALLDAGANPDVIEATSGKSPLMLAIARPPSTRPAPALPVAALLMSHGANVNLPDSTGRTALHYACMDGRIELVEQLLKSTEIDLNVRDNSGISPIVLATASAQADNAVVRLLVKRGADPSGLVESRQSRD